MNALSKERVVRVIPGWPMLALNILLHILAVTLIIRGAAHDEGRTVITGTLILADPFFSASGSSS